MGPGSRRDGSNTEAHLEHAELSFSSDRGEVEGPKTRLNKYISSYSTLEIFVYKQ